ncbi:MAG: hypothetical protein ACJAVI_002644 [Candidatus Azotimanducaceae bacterium]|jgi:hypothetical protein
MSILPTVNPLELPQDQAILEHQILTLAGQLNATEYHLLKRLDAFDECGGWHGDGIKSFSHWLNWKIGMGNVMAREKVRVAKALRDLPLIDAAFAEGVLSYTKVRAMSRIATTANESFLLQIAEYGTAQQLERLVRKFCSLNQQELDSSEEIGERQIPTCDWFEDDQDMVTFKIKLAAEDALNVIHTIDRIADQLYEPEPVPEKKTETDKNVSAETFSEPGFKHDGFNQQGFENEEKATRSECRARAFALLAEQTSAGNELLLHLQANPENIDYKINGGPTGYTDNNLSVSPKTLRRMTCDCKVTTAFEDSNGHILDIGRKSRVIPTKLGRVIKQRDQGCRFPGCCQTKLTDIHHIQRWIDGGETTLDNLVTLCGKHHTQLHQGKYQIHRCIQKGQDIKTLSFINSTNQVIPVSFYQNSKSSLPITTKPVVSKWQGDELDIDYALQVLDELKQAPFYSGSIYS